MRTSERPPTHISYEICIYDTIQSRHSGEIALYRIKYNKQIITPNMISNFYPDEIFNREKHLSS